MRKKRFLAVVIVAACLCIGSALVEPVLHGQEAALWRNPDSLELARRIDAVTAEVKSARADVRRTLDQVLANQEKILKELEVVKVRATRR